MQDAIYIGLNSRSAGVLETNVDHLKLDSEYDRKIYIDWYLKIIMIIIKKVDALSIEQPARNNHQPIGHQISRLSRPIFAQKSIFWGKYGR